MSSGSKRIVKVVGFLNESLHVVGTVRDGGQLSYWIEREPGRPWLQISEPGASSHGVDERREFVALTWSDDGQMMARAAMATGWFVRTGREVPFPVNERNEVWALSPAGRKALVAGGLQEAEAVSSVAAALLPPQPPHPDLTVDEVMRTWLESLDDADLNSIVVTVPNPFTDPQDRSRMIAALHPETLKRNSSLFESPDGHLLFNPMVEWKHLDEVTNRRWAKFMLEAGHATVVILRIPVSGDHYIECLLFGPRKLFDTAQVAISVWNTLNLTPQLKQAVSQSVVKLTPRERSCLASAFRGKTANEIAEDLALTPRTVRMHLSTAMNKFKTNNTVAAIRGAQMVCNL